MLTLVLLPGMDGTCRLFDPLLQALGNTITVKPVAYPEDIPLGYRELVDLVKESLPKDAPYVLLGESFSGPIAVIISSLNPDNLKGLILCCSFVKNPQPALKMFHPLINMAPISKISVQIVSKLLLGEYDRDELLESIVEVTNSLDPEVIRKRVDEFLNIDVSEELAQVTVPSLYLRASHDWAVPQSASELISKILPEIQVKTLSGPHFLLQAEPDKSAKIILEFVQDVEKTI